MKYSQEELKKFMFEEIEIIQDIIEDYVFFNFGMVLRFNFYFNLDLCNFFGKKLKRKKKEEGKVCIFKKVKNLKRLQEKMMVEGIKKIWRLMEKYERELRKKINFVCILKGIQKYNKVSIFGVRKGILFSSYTEPFERKKYLVVWKKIIISFIFVVFMSIPFSKSLAWEKSYENKKITAYGNLRFFYINDQRISWSGCEATFGTEGEGIVQYSQKYNWGDLILNSEIFLNQPYGKNILATSGRTEWFANFRKDTIEISQLYLQLKKSFIQLTIGKTITPFGKFYEFILSNSHFDAPFIRTEAILWRETGLFLTIFKKHFEFSISCANGEENKDTNSSKAILARIGYKNSFFRMGISGKYQDGIGSESQKYYNNHIGIDWALKFKRILVSGELIYDQYGFHRKPEIDEIFWPHSIYYRWIYPGKRKDPIWGVGGYISFQYLWKFGVLTINYGEYHHEKIGNIYHDPPNKRFIFKTIWKKLDPSVSFISWDIEKLKQKLFDGLTFFTVFILENDRPFPIGDLDPWVIYIGFQYGKF
jgi:hypothetical protein